MGLPAVASQPLAPLTVRYPTRRCLLSASRAEGLHVSLFAPTPLRLPPGTPVDLAIQLADCERTFRLQARVSFLRRVERGVGQEAGLGLSFEGEHKWAAAQMLAFCAGRPPELGTSARERVGTRIRCLVRTGNLRFDAEVQDLSATGLFVATERLSRLRPGQDLVIRLEPGWFGWRGKPMEARVVWRGAKKGTPGFGARFLGVPAHTQAALRKYLPGSA